MICMTEVYDLLGESFAYTSDTFHWGDNAVVRGSLRNMPAPSKIKALYNGKYFALYEIVSIEGDDTQSGGVWGAIYTFNILLCYRGATGDITKFRTDMIEKFTEGFENFWLERDQWTMEYLQVFPSVDEVETELECVAVGISGTLRHITEKGSRLDG